MSSAEDAGGPASARWRRLDTPGASASCAALLEMAPTGFTRRYPGRHPGLWELDD
jgi:hypothetical protein